MEMSESSKNRADELWESASCSQEKPRLPFHKRWAIVSSRGLLIWIVILTAIISIVYLIGGLHYKTTQDTITVLENQIQMLKDSTNETQNNFGLMLAEEINRTKTIQESKMNLLEELLHTRVNNTNQGLEAHQNSNQEAVEVLQNRIQAMDQEIQEIKRDAGTLKSGMNSSIQHLQQGMENVTNELDYITGKSTRLVLKECGGIISMPSTRSTVLVEYKLNEMYDNNERCLWIVNNVVNWKRFHLNLNLRLISHGFASSDDGLFSFGVNRHGSLNAQRLNLNVSYSISYNAVFLSFTSNHLSAGKGFLLEMTLNPSTPDSSGINLFYASSPGQYNVTSWNANGLTTIVIYPRKQTIFKVLKINTENSNDALFVSMIHELGHFISKSSIYGNQNNPLTVNTSAPILCLFSTAYTRQNRDLQLSWE